MAQYSNPSKGEKMPEAIFEKFVNENRPFFANSVTLNMQNVKVLGTMTEHDRIRIMADLPHWKMAYILAENNSKFEQALNSPRAEEYIFWSTKGLKAQILENSFPFLRQKDRVRLEKEAHWIRLRNPDFFDNIFTPEAYAAIIEKGMIPIASDDNLNFLAIHLPFSIIGPNYPFWDN